MAAHIQLYPKPAYDMTAEDRAEEAAERLEEERDEYIEDNAPKLASALPFDESFAEGTLNNLPNDVLAGFATELGTFFARYHGAADMAGEAGAGYYLYRTLKPYIEAAALEQAQADAADAFDADQARRERDSQDAEADYAERAA